MSSKKRSVMAVIVPTFNERENLAELMRRIHEAAPDARVLVVDDASPDGTGELAEDLKARDPAGRIDVLHRERKEGLGTAYIAGFRQALARWPEAGCLVQMDADLSHDPAYLPAMTEAMQAADIAVGSRYVEGISIVNWPLERLVISRLATAYARMVTGLPVTDSTSGFKCYRREVIESMNLGGIRSNGYAFQIETSFRAWRAGWRMCDVPIIFYDRTRGESKLHLGIAWEAFRIVLWLGLIRLMTNSRARRTPTIAAGENATGSKTS